MDHRAVEFAHGGTAHGAFVAFTLDDGLPAIVIRDQNVNAAIFGIRGVEHLIALTGKNAVGDIVLKGRWIQANHGRQRKRAPFPALTPAAQPLPADVAPAQNHHDAQ